MHRQLIMSHNLFTDIKNQLTRRKIVTYISFYQDMKSTIPLCISISLQNKGMLRYVRPNLISIW